MTIRGRGVEIGPSPETPPAAPRVAGAAPRAGWGRESPRMAAAPTLFFDIGGVLLTNGWDTGARKRAAETFGVDYQEFQTRHEMLKTAFETGRLSLDG